MGVKEKFRRAYKKQILKKNLFCKITGLGAAFKHIKLQNKTQTHVTKCFLLTGYNDF